MIGKYFDFKYSIPERSVFLKNSYICSIRHENLGIEKVITTTGVVVGKFIDSKGEEIEIYKHKIETNFCGIIEATRLSFMNNDDLNYLSLYPNWDINVKGFETWQNYLKYLKKNWRKHKCSLEFRMSIYDRNFPFDEYCNIHRKFIDLNMANEVCYKNCNKKCPNLKNKYLRCKYSKYVDIQKRDYSLYFNQFYVEKIEIISRFKQEKGYYYLCNIDDRYYILFDNRRLKNRIYHNKKIKYYNEYIIFDKDK
ncbi:MAG: hypothetical protein LBM05_00535 [Endomicrobium sp.]|jgi:hypothetical protein|nr:hypothetical protein [Endomicrobium sp.]